MSTVSMNTNIAIHGPLLDQSKVCEPILRALPEWFGLEHAILHYVEQIDTLPTFTAMNNNKVMGFLAIKQHNDFSAEIYVMGILPEYHRKGTGRQLTIKAEEYLKKEKVEFFQVKTVSESRECEPYAKTREFYKTMDFRPLEEFKTLWDEANPCLLMIKKL